MWKFEQATGVMVTADGTRLSPAGYAGAGAGKNNPAMQDDIDVGPLPCGFYTIMAMYNDSATGPDTMVLIPDLSNEMFGRSGFRIHGDDVEDPGHGSDGCIVQSRPIRIRIGMSGDTRLQVVSGT